MSSKPFTPEERAYLLEKVKGLEARIVYLQERLSRITDMMFVDQAVIQSLEEKNSLLTKQVEEYRKVEEECREAAREAVSLAEYWQLRTHG